MYTYSGAELLGQTISISGELVYPRGYIILCFHSNVMGILVPHLCLVISIFKFSHSAVKVKVAQSCLTLCDPMDYTVRGIFQARIL